MITMKAASLMNLSIFHQNAHGNLKLLLAEAHEKMNFRYEYYVFS